MIAATHTAPFAVLGQTAQSYEPPVLFMSKAQEKRAELVRNDGPILVVFVVGLWVLLALAASLAIATTIYCISKGYNLSVSLTWRSWVSLAVTCRKN